MSILIRFGLVLFITGSSSWSFAREDAFTTVMGGLSTFQNLHADALIIQDLIPALTPEERGQVVQRLHHLGIYNFGVLALIIETGTARPADFIRFLSIASMHFAREVAPPSPLRLRRPDHAPQAVDIVISKTLEQLSLRLRDSDPEMREIFESAIDKAESDVPFGYSRDHRLLFFEMFEKGSLNWTDKGLAKLRASYGGVSARFKLRSRYRTQGNVIHLRPPHRPCAGGLVAPE